MLSNILHHPFYLPEVDIQVKNGQGVLGSLVPSILDFGLLQVSKNDDEDHCFLK
jgi:hypothetical protein